jgi:hypothetical protein
MYIGLHVKCPLFLLDFNETFIFLIILEKYSNIKFHENLSSGSRVVSCRQTDWWKGGQTQTDMTKLVVSFCSFANEPKNFYFIRKFTVELLIFL